MHGCVHVYVGVYFMDNVLVFFLGVFYKEAIGSLFLFHGFGLFFNVNISRDIQIKIHKIKIYVFHMFVVS